MVKKGHLNFSLSHYFSVLFKQNLSTSDLASMWKNFPKLLNNNGILYYAFYTNDFSILNKNERIVLARLLRCMGYFIFQKEISASPQFVKLNNRLVLTDNSNLMTFHFKRNKPKCYRQYQKHFSVSYIPDNTNICLFSGNHVDLIVDDPKNESVTQKKYIGNFYESNLNELQKEKFHKCYDFTSYNISFSLHISNYQLNSDINSFDDTYFDGMFYYGIKFNYRVSFYNYYLDRQNIVMNLASMSCIKLTQEKYYALKQQDLSVFNEEEIENLSEMSFIHPFVNETKFYKNLSAKKTQKELSLSVLTTTGCNANCFYCYESGLKAVNMNKEVVKDLKKFIIQYEPSTVKFGWFGGEPLVNAKVIDELSEFCQENKIPYSATMISNGALVDTYLNKMLTLWKIKRIQITLDGVGEKYDTAKNFKDKKSNNFENTIKNIHLLINSGILVNIRLNFNQENYADVLECISFIKEEFGCSENLKVYACHIFGGKDTIHLPDGRNLYLIIYRKLMECGYIESLSDLRFNFINKGYCFTNNTNHFVINSDGNIFTCDHSIVDLETGGIGNLKTGVEYNEKYRFWTGLNYPLKQCKKCKFFFACQGGCKYEFNFNKNKLSPCLWQFEIIDDLILSAIEYKII